jgi:hypothetical protein
MKLWQPSGQVYVSLAQMAQYQTNLAHLRKSSKMLCDSRPPVILQKLVSGTSLVSWKAHHRSIIHFAEKLLRKLVCRASAAEKTKV